MAVPPLFLTVTPSITQLPVVEERVIVGLDEPMPVMRDTTGLLLPTAFTPASAPESVSGLVTTICWLLKVPAWT